MPCIRCPPALSAVIAFPLSILQMTCCRSSAPKLPPICHWNIWTCGPGSWKVWLTVNLAVCTFSGLRVTPLGGRNKALPGYMHGIITGPTVLQLKRVNGLLGFLPSIPCFGIIWFGSDFPDWFMIIRFKWPSRSLRRLRLSTLSRWR